MGLWCLMHPPRLLIGMQRTMRLHAQDVRGGQGPGGRARVGGGGARPRGALQRRGADGRAAVGGRRAASRARGGSRTALPLQGSVRHMDRVMAGSVFALACSAPPYDPGSTVGCVCCRSQRAVRPHSGCWAAPWELVRSRCCAVSPINGNIALPASAARAALCPVGDIRSREETLVGACCVLIRVLGVPRMAEHVQCACGSSAAAWPRLQTAAGIGSRCASARWCRRVMPSRWSPACSAA